MNTATEKDFNGFLRAIEKFTDKKKSKKISSITSKTDLALRIKKAMTGKEITQRQLAARMGISVPVLNHKINGKSKFDLFEAFLLAEILQMPFDELFFKYPY